jgi:hypothetical protein
MNVGQLVDLHAVLGQFVASTDCRHFSTELRLVDFDRREFLRREMAEEPPSLEQALGEAKSSGCRYEMRLGPYLTDPIDPDPLGKSKGSDPNGGSDPDSAA